MRLINETTLQEIELVRLFKHKGKTDKIFRPVNFYGKEFIHNNVGRYQHEFKTMYYYKNENENNGYVKKDFYIVKSFKDFQDKTRAVNPIHVLVRSNESLNTRSAYININSPNVQKPMLEKLLESATEYAATYEINLTSLECERVTEQKDTVFFEASPSVGEYSEKPVFFAYNKRLSEFIKVAPYMENGAKFLLQTNNPKDYEIYLLTTVNAQKSTKERFKTYLNDLWQNLFEYLDNKEYYNV